MKNLIIVLAALCIFAHATTVFQTPAFLEIKANPFGKSLASLVELNMSAKGGAGRLDAIAEVLNTVQKTLQERQAHNEGEISRERGWCSDQVESLELQISQTSNNVSGYENEQATLLNEQRTLSHNLENEKNQLKSNQDNLANTNSKLVEENSNYAVSSKDYSEAIAACEQGISLLNNLKANQASFIQTRAKFGSVVSLLQRHLANKTSSFIQPVLSVLTELANSSQELDQAKLGKVISLIQQLLEELRNQEASNNQRHKEAVENFEGAISSLEGFIHDSSILISSYETRLTEVENRLVQLEGLIAQLKNLLEILKNQLSETHNTCDNYEKGFSDVDHELAEQVATLEKLKEFFKQHVVTAVENIRDSAYADELTVPV